MKTKILALLVVLLMSFTAVFPACAEWQFYQNDPLDDEISRVCLIKQNDLHYQGKSFRYDNEAFGIRGCGPASVTNMLLALFRVEAQEMTDALLRDTMKVLCNYKDPKTRAMDIRHISYLLQEETGADTVFGQLQKEMGGSWLFLPDTMNIETVLKWMDEPHDEGAVLTTYIQIQNQGEDFAKLLCELYNAGLDEAEVYLTYVTGGTGTMGGPFRSSDGHYITLLFPVGHWMTEGGFYLIDSNPRALKDEQTRSARYWTRYPFVANWNCTEFRETWYVQRMRTTCLRFGWTEAQMAKTEEIRAADDTQELEKLYTKQVNMLGLYGTGLLLIKLPGA